MAAVETTHSQQNFQTENGHFDVPVDAEHNGIRVAGCGMFIASFALIMLGMNLLLPGTAVLSILLSIVIAALVTYFADMLLKKHWPSGRRVSARPDRVAITKHGEVEREIDPQKQVNVLLWRFEVRRSGRVKKGWYVIACSLQQGDTYLPVYTFVPPDQFEEVPLSDSFVTLQRKRKLKGVTASERDMRLAGQQRRAHEAETDRGMFGAEMNLAQFTNYLAYLQENFPRWMPEK